MPRSFTFRTFLLAVAFAILDVAGHVLLGPPLHYPNPSPLLAYPTLMKVVALALLVAAFSTAAFTYLRFEPGLPGDHGARRGLRFGLAWAGFWLVGGLEMPLLSGGSLAQELATAFIDVAALLGLLVTTGALAGRPPPTRRVGLRAPTLLQAGLVVAAAGLGRVIVNLVIPTPDLGAAPFLDPLATAAWSLSVGGVYLALRPALGEGGPWRRAGRAALGFGVSQLLGFAFLPVFTRVEPGSLVGRLAILLAFTAAGFAAAERSASRGPGTRPFRGLVVPGAAPQKAGTQLVASARASTKTRLALK